MLRLACLAASAALLLSVDAGSLRALPADNTDAVKKAAQKNAAAPGSSSSARIQEQSRLDILRNVDGEFAKALTSLPATNKGFRLKVGQPVDQEALRKSISSSGIAVNSGENVQITRLVFLPQGILFDLNGGGRVKRSLRSHFEFGMSVPTPTISTSSTSTASDMPTEQKKTGATLILDFNRPLPDLKPDQVKQLLATVLDFTRQRSAAQHWVETLAPSVQKAIREKRAEVGMDREEVQVAMGRPDRKVRERNAEGQEIEDWIYGRPPSQTTFVRFAGEKVSQIDQFP